MTLKIGWEAAAVASGLTQAQIDAVLLMDRMATRHETRGGITFITSIDGAHHAELPEHQFQGVQDFRAAFSVRPDGYERAA